MNEIHRRMARVTEKESRLKNLYLEGELSTGESRELKADLAQHLTELKAQAAQRAAEAEQGEKGLQTQRQILAQLDLVQQWDALEHHQRKSLLQHLINQVTVFRDKRTGALDCRLDWRWRAEADALNFSSVIARRFGAHHS